MCPPLKRMQKAAQAAILALSFLVSTSAHADWANFGTISMTDPVTPRLDSTYGCYTDGKDIACNNATSAVTFGTGGLIDLGGLTVAGSISASAVSATYISGTVIQVNSSSKPCGSGLGGAIRYNSGSIQYCDGVGPTWQELASSSGIQGDRIVSGSTSAIANSNAQISFTTGGVDRMSVGPGNSVTIGIASTPISVTVYGSDSTVNGRNLLSIRNDTDAPFTPAGIGFFGKNNIQMGRAYYTWDGNAGTGYTNFWLTTRNSSGSEVPALRVFNGNVWVQGGINPTGYSPAYALESWTGGPTSSLYKGLALLAVNNTAAGAGPGIGDRILWKVETATNNAYADAAAIDGVADDTADASMDASLRFSTIGPDAASTTGPTEKMRITGAGAVGIGMQSPTATLQVSGTFTVSTSVQAADAPGLFVSKYGNVGFGTNAPVAALHVKGAQASIMMEETTGGANNEAFLTHYNNAFSIQNRNSDGTYRASPFTMDIRAPDYTFYGTSSGSIGVGTPFPASSLTIVGEVQPGSSGATCVTATNGGAIRYSAGTLYYCNGSNTWASITGGGAGFTGGGSATAIAFWNGPNSLTYESATTSGLYWDHINGRLGIGTDTPSSGFNISSTTGTGIRLDANSSNNPFIDLKSNGTIKGNIYWSIANNAFVINDANTNTLLNSGGGNVGVGLGLITPTATLQVSGTLTVSTTGQNSLSSASLAVDSRGVSVSSIIHLGSNPIVPIGAGGNAILSGTTAVSTSTAGSITMFTGGSPRITVDASGNITIPTGLIYGGTSSSVIGISAGPTTTFAANSAGIALRGATAAYDAGGLEFYTGTGAVGAERMRIDAGGRVGINTSSPDSYLTISNVNNPQNRSGINIMGYAGGLGWGLRMQPANDSSPVAVVFFNSGGSTQVGSISTNSTATTYNTSSDRRLKENIADTREGLQKLMLIGVKDFSFKADSSHTIVNGFIAQDLNKIYPEAVTTNGDDGKAPLKDNSRVWQVDYGRVTPLVVKAVQDLKALFDSAQADTDAKLNAANHNIAVLKAANDNLARRVDALQKELRGSHHAVR